MKHIKFLFGMLLATSFFIGCNNNPASSGGSIWTQGTGVSNVNHFYATGGNLLASTYCAPCSQAYIFLSRDEGLTWKLDTTFHVYNHFDNGYVTNGLYLSAPITFMSNGRYLFAGVSDCYRGAIYRSSDNGITWSNQGIRWPENDSDHSEDISCFSVLNGNIFAGTYHGVFVSTDEGTTWRANSMGMPITYTGRPPSISGLAGVGGDLFASTYAFGIYRSTSNDGNWIMVNSTDYDFRGLAAIGYEVFAAAFNDQGNPSTGGVLATTDSGQTWRHADAGLPDHGVNVIYSNGSYLFAGTDTTIFASSDGGITWINISTGSPTQGGDGGASGLYVYGSYLFANSTGSVWRYPLFALPGFCQNTENEISNKSKGG